MKKIFYLFIATAALLATGCDKDFEEVNTTGNNALVTDPNLLLAAFILNTQNVVYNGQIGGDMGSVWGQHWSKVYYNDEEHYVPRRDAMDNVWDALYFNVIKEAKDAYSIAGNMQEPNTNLQAVSLVLQANAFQVLTDVYGPVVFSEFGASKPGYNSQEEVYDGILAMLDEAEAKFATGHGTFTASADFVYGGDITKWRKFAASLKLKALMRISGKRSVGAQVQALVDSGLLFSSNADSAQMAFAAFPDANPIFEMIVQQNRPEYKVSSVLVGQLNSLNDPRLAVYADQNIDGAYVGDTSGVMPTTATNKFSAVGAFYLDPSLPGVFLSYAQVELYLAEAINEGIIVGSIADAKAHYVNGINASFEFNQLAPDPSYTSSAAVDFTTQADAKVKIATQMWLALYGQGLETWTEWRRTKLPALVPVVDAVLTQLPSRFYFSTDEPLVNRSNYEAATATLANGDTMLTKVWWMN